MRQKQRRRGTHNEVIAAVPELSLAAGSGTINTKVLPVAQRGILAHDYPTRAPIERAIARAHALGPRVLAQFLDELASEFGIGSEIIRRLEQYQRLAPATLAATGGERFPPPPIRSAWR